MQPQLSTSNVQLTLGTTGKTNSSPSSASGTHLTVPTDGQVRHRRSFRELPCKIVGENFTLGKPKPRSLPLIDLVEKPYEQLRRAVKDWSEPVTRQTDVPSTILRLSISWPGHVRPEIVVSKRLQAGRCKTLGELAVEVATECRDMVKNWSEGDAEDRAFIKRIFAIEVLHLVALYHVSDSDGNGAYHAEVESLFRD